MNTISSSSKEEKGAALREWTSALIERSENATKAIMQAERLCTFATTEEQREMVESLLNTADFERYCLKRTANQGPSHSHS